ncbi:MAG: hypothetical protein ACOY0T_37345 [Myxococcota bacterium]
MSLRGADATAYAAQMGIVIRPTKGMLPAGIVVSTAGNSLVYEVDPSPTVRADRIWFGIARIVSDRRGWDLCDECVVALANDLRQQPPLLRPKSLPPRTSGIVRRPRTS